MDEYDLGGITAERLARLNDSQRDIVLKREEKKTIRLGLIARLKENDPDVHEMVFNALQNLDDDMCEHDRSIWSNCLACAEIDHLLFPELYDEDGIKIGEP